MSRSRLAVRIRLATLGLMVGASLGVSADNGEAPTRAQDPDWGEVLYDYYQGNALDALTRLAVARQEGGIDGHGQHPALVEGGLMLSWGMLREARDRFQQLLDDSVDVRLRNQAWFYLAKVFYLETDHDSARNALAQLDQTVFREQQPELYRESLYLQGQIALKDQLSGEAPELAGILDDLPDDSLFSAYLRYNRILVGGPDHREQALEALASDLDDDDWQDARQGERQALQDRIRLTLAALRYQSGEHSEVPKVLAGIDDQSLFGARARRLETLSAEGEDAEQVLAHWAAMETGEASPQQMALVRGVLHERAGRREQALTAYRDAASYWQDRYDGAAGRLVAPNQDDLLAAVVFASEEQGRQRWLPGTTLLEFPESIVTDPYGRLEVMPAPDAGEDAAGLAELIAGESFQRALKDFHELNQMARLLESGDQKLASFNLMLETRRQQRSERIRQTRKALAGIEDDQWFQRQQAFHEQVGRAESEEDAAFFMTREQKALSKRLERAQARLARLPDDERTAEQRRKLERVAASLTWQLVDDYGPNRWQVRSELNRLDAALDELTARKARLEQEMASPGALGELSARVEESHGRLRGLTGAIADARNDARNQLLAQLRDHYRRDQQQAHRYLLASRLAETRLLDQQYREDRNSLEASPEQLAATLDQLITRYRELLVLLDDPEALHATRYRLHDLMFIEAEGRYADTAEDTFDPVIAGYQALLKDNPGHADNHRIRYQLARIYDLRGDRDAQRQELETLIEQHPDSPLWVEAQFRRAELLFIEGDYAAAETGYAAVIRASDGSEDERQQTFASHAFYMKGWSEFRQGDYDTAVVSYSHALDRLLPDNATPGDLDRQHQTLVEDLFRVLGLSFSYQGGAPAVADLFERIGPRPWEPVVYERYAEQLQGREQYTDAIGVYQQYIDAHPFSEQSPHYAVRIMDIYRDGGFPEAVPPAQARFVEQYGVRSAYWQQAPDTVRGAIRDQLIVLLPELANRHYLQAQDATDPAIRDQQYDMAATFYLDFADTFPDHPKTPEMLFLLAETRLAQQQWGAAIEIFERVAYDHGQHDRAAEAGYAAILAYRESGLTDNADGPWPDLEQQSRIRFASRFPDDERAEAILYSAIQYEAAAGNHRGVQELGDRLLSWQPLQDPTLALETRLLQAQSYYDTGDYRSAEQAYTGALADMPADDGRRSQLQDSLAASVYQQGEQLLEAGEKQAAVTEWLRVAQSAPGTEISARARYDAAGLLLDMGDYDDALMVMNDLRTDQPDHELTAQLPARMALAYRETGQWQRAAEELTILADRSTDPDTQRENRWLAAELYDRGGSEAEAIDAYQRYAQQWPDPVGPYMEAANRLAELHAERGDGDSRQYWLQQQIATADRLGDSATNRTAMLASEAAITLADQSRADFEAIRLAPPLQDNLRAKMGALEAAADGYEKAAAYGHEDYNSQAGYRLAELYRTLANDLMNSERPAGLSDMETMQYELLLEEQAYPFEDDAIAIHEQNIEQTRDGHYDAWIRRSFEALGKLLPARYQKPEQAGGAVHELE
ncbi:tetratricopeptide repeat protein [Marinobacter lacisalsi]|uniref:Tetratricopeptide repeat protein n=1 Tax=Marinobacter lacisalsi TaxID=475979 RepID=A0ABV8QEE3_9GAMM